MNRLEQTILKNLIYNEEYSRKVLPFIRSDYFSDNIEKTVFKEVFDFTNHYKNPPTHEALVINFTEKKDVSEDVVKGAIELLNELNQAKEEPTETSWLIDQTEKFCQDRAIYNAIMESVGILDNKSHNKSKGEIPQLLSDALGVSFDNTVGHDYINDSDARYEAYHRVESRIRFDLDLFNKITKGGLPIKTLNIALAGCVHPDTKVKIRFRKRISNFEEKSVNISEIEKLLNDGYDVEVDSPDGFVPVSLFVDKGEWVEYILTLSDDRKVKVNENHLFETENGWKYAKDLLNLHTNFLTDVGFLSGSVVKTGKTIPIVDIQVEHENHRYYTNGVSSHNTGVGKSLFMCHVASGCLSQGHNVLYITMEMAEEKIAERIDANLLNIDLNELHTLSREDYEKKFSALKSKTHGKLIIKEYPTASASVLHFRALLNDLAIKKNFKPDIIFIDYLNICCSARIKPGANVNSYSYIKSIAEELRGLAVENALPIVSATQTTRSGFSSSDPGLEDTSESFGLPATADFMFALVSNEELEALGQILVKQLKNRYGDPNDYKRFVLGIDRAKMRLYDAESSAQADIVDAGREDKPLNTFGNRDNKFKKNFEGMKV
jgi:replicative DNA helicase